MCLFPYDPQPPSVGSGIRVGTPSVTTQGMLENDMREIADLIHRAVTDADGSADAVAERMLRVTGDFGSELD